MAAMVAQQSMPARSLVHSNGCHIGFSQGKLDFGWPETLSGLGYSVDTDNRGNRNG